MSKIRVRGTSPLTGMFLIFLVLKLTGTIDWSWWWVTAPLWIPIIIVCIVIIVVAIL